MTPDRRSGAAIRIGHHPLFLPSRRTDSRHKLDRNNTDLPRSVAFMAGSSN